MLLETLASIERVRNDSVAEVIIVNDGSTDPTTCGIFQDLDAEKYTVVHQRNEGLGRARNAGIEIAKGEFILPLDSDNLIRKAYLDRGVSFLLEHPDVGVVYGDAEYFGEKTGRWTVAEFDWRSLVKMNYIDACALYRKSVWQSVDGYDEKMPIMGWEDWDFWMRAAMRGWKFVHIDEVAFDYRVRTGSMLSEACRHTGELIAYIFGKPEYEILGALRDQAVQLEELSRKFRSWDYRVGNVIVAPIRKVTRIPSGIRRRLRKRASGATSSNLR